MLLCVCSNYFFIETNLLLTAIVFEIHKKKNTKTAICYLLPGQNVQKKPLVRLGGHKNVLFSCLFFSVANRKMYRYTLLASTK